METKKCTKCGEVKALGEYNKDYRRKYGVQSECRGCNRHRNHIYDVTKREKQSDSINNLITNEMKTEIQFQKTLITPSLAVKLLQANIKNRAVNKVIVGSYANEMTAGRWREDTGEVIKISNTGIVLDGQHRLFALIKANASIYFHIASGISDSVMDVLDTGKSRNASDVFSIEGIKHSNSIPSIITTYTLLKDKKYHNGDKGSRPTNQVVLTIYNERVEFWQTTAKKTINWYNSFAKILTPSVIGGLYTYFYDINNESANEFFDQVTTGQNITNNTIALLRQKLMQDKMSTQKKMTSYVKYALIIKTWNAFRLGESPKLLKFNPDVEKFPKAV